MTANAVTFTSSSTLVRREKHRASEDGTPYAIALKGEGSRVYLISSDSADWLRKY
jgi:hypothetical protein